MDISVTFEELGAVLAETLEKTAGGDAALQEVSSGDAAPLSLSSEGGSSTVTGTGTVLYPEGGGTGSGAGTDGQLEVLSEQVEHLDYLLEKELLPALHNGFLACSLIGGLLCGMFLILLFVKGRR